MIDAVVFDLDGVLIDSEPVWERVRRDLVAERGGHWAPDAQRRLMGMSTPEWARYLSEDLGVGLPPQEVAALVIDRMAASYRKHIPLLPGAVDAVHRLAARWPLGVASSAAAVLIETVLQSADLRSCFQVTMSTEQVPRGKPAPDIYLAVTERLGFPPAACAAIEDSSNGLRSAAAAGLHVIAIPHPQYLPDPDALAATSLVLPTLADLTPDAVASLGLSHRPLSRPMPRLADNRRVRRALRGTGRWIWSVRRLMLLTGALLILAFPAPNLEFLAWFGLVPGLVLIVRAPTAREGGIRAWWLGAGYLTAALYWMAPEIGPGVLLVGAVMGVLWVPFGVAAQALLRPPVTWPRALAALVVVPSCWLLTEWLRSWQALGGPWAVFGVSQWQHPAVLALAAVGGVWLISVALIMANVAILLLIGSLPRTGAILRSEAVASPRAPGPQAAEGTAPTAPLRPGLAVLGAAVALASAGAGPLAFALTPASPAAREATVAMVQPGIVSNAVQRVDASERLTAELSGSGKLSGVKPDLIVWGESSTAVDLTLAKNRDQLAKMETLAAEDAADLLVDQDATPPGQGHEKWSVLVGPSGIKGIYVKTRLVPFGEYIPFRQQLGWLTRISKAAASNMIPGTGAHLLYPSDRAGKPLPIGVLICFESAFPDMSRVDTDLGAQLIVYQSATSTFQGTWGPDQHASLSAVRAAETGRPVVQAALTGVTAAFDARGRLLAWMGQSSHGVVTVRLGLPAASARTIYDQFGDYVPWSALAVVIAAALVMFANSRGFPGRRGGAKGGHGAQYVAGQSVPS